MISSDGGEIGIYQDVLKAGHRYKYTVKIYGLYAGGVIISNFIPSPAAYDNILTITQVGTYTGYYIPTTDGRFHIRRNGITDVVIEDVSVKEVPFSMEKQTIEMTVNDDSTTRYADIIIRKGCPDAVNVRFLSRKMGVRYWQFNRFNQTSQSVKEIGRVLNNIDNMSDESHRESVVGYESVKTVDCSFLQADIDEQALLCEIFTSPKVQMQIGSSWVDVKPKGSHVINNKRQFANFRISFELPSEYNQEL
jgi:hypothetical protein